MSFSLAACSEKKDDLGALKQPGEEVIFGFHLRNNDSKMAVVCAGGNNSYLVYRFGTKDKVELSYPPLLDGSSWKIFSYSGYYRGGGRQNAAMSYGTLTFNNNGAVYEVYEEWSGEDDSHSLGITVSVKGKVTDIKGNTLNKYGALSEMSQYKDLIPNEYYK